MLTSEQTSCFGRSLGESLSVFNQVSAFEEPQYLFPYVLASASTMGTGMIDASGLTTVLRTVCNWFLTGVNNCYSQTNRKGITIM